MTRLIGAAAVASGLLAAPIAASAEDIVIGHSQPNLGWPYIAAVTNALEAAAADMDGVEVVTLSADGDIAKQSSDINSLVNRGVDVLLVTSLDGNAVIPALKKAHDAGIPILAVSNEPAEPGQALLAGYSGPDDYVQGAIAAELLNDSLGGKGGIAIIEGSPGQSTTLLRTQGLKDRLAELKSGITILGAQTADWNPVKAKDVAQAFLTAYGDDMVGVFAQDDNTGAAAAEVFKAAGRGDIKVVGTGGTIDGLKAIRDGLMYGTMDQSPTTDAKQALKFAIMLANGESLPEKRNIIPMPKITAENVGDFKGEW
ncbi:MAG: sugar ABC transporter substrate-binding protein [Bauldia sp.]|uniref:sugar ABC transporter substrate-binding protein n=1 Tax=Bauldia sp. TaxID=2575872 RepID=UPI001D7424D7|nr:sugar ABC transporter substrate-binding protein [Bauldia sp.]MCB1488864.1 sugar ABC transporter substrate-binding protein [Bauldia sp.]MCB1495618.1 sugar ABC transporter substrate-binding protein [Bauldia sp.]